MKFNPDMDGIIYGIKKDYCDLSLKDQYTILISKPHYKNEWKIRSGDCGSIHQAIAGLVTCFSIDLFFCKDRGDDSLEFIKLIERLTKGINQSIMKDKFGEIDVDIKDLEVM